MPCYDHRNTYDYGRQEAQAEIDKMARWLCSILGMLEAQGIEIEFQDQELKEWWIVHKVFDQARKDAEEE